MLDVNFAKRFGLALGVNGFPISEKLFPYFSESWQILPLNQSLNEFLDELLVYNFPKFKSSHTARQQVELLLLDVVTESAIYMATAALA